MENENKKKKKDKSDIKSNYDILLSLFILIKTHKKWWLLPFLLVLAFLGLFISLTGNHSVLPAIYALF